MRSCDIVLNMAGIVEIKSYVVALNMACTVLE